MDQTRRDFLKTSAGVVICGCTGLSVSACAMLSGRSNMPVVPTEAVHLSENKIVVDVARVPALSSAGGSAKLTIQGTDEKKICIVRIDELQFAAFTNKCTHLGRELEYKHDEKKLRCVSFGHSEFDLEGRNLNGPADGKVSRLAVTQRGHLLEIAT